MNKVHSIFCLRLHCTRNIPKNREVVENGVQDTLVFQRCDNKSTCKPIFRTGTVDKMTYANEEHRSDTLTPHSGYSQQLTFAGCPSFMRRPFSRDLNGIDLAITGIPFDCATTNRPGTRLGPRAIREPVSYTHLTLPTTPYV